MSMEGAAHVKFCVLPKTVEQFEQSVLVHCHDEYITDPWTICLAIYSAQHHRDIKDFKIKLLGDNLIFRSIFKVNYTLFIKNIFGQHSGLAPYFAGFLVLGVMDLQQR